MENMTTYASNKRRNYSDVLVKVPDNRFRDGYRVEHFRDFIELLRYMNRKNIKVRHAGRIEKGVAHQYTVYKSGIIKKIC